MQAQFDLAALAILAGDIVGLEELCRDFPALARFRTSTGHSTLLQIVACEEPHVPRPEEAVTVLLSAGAATVGPFLSAAGCNAERTLMSMLELGVSVDVDIEGWTALDEALYWNNLGVAATLVDRGADTRRLRRAAGLGRVAAADSFFESDVLLAIAGPLASPFSDTIAPGEHNDPAAILDHAFVMAANCGQQAAAALLLDRGARLNHPPPGYHWKGTALHAAIWRGEFELVRWLLERGADPTLRDGLADADALGWADHHNQPEIASILR